MFQCSSIISEKTNRLKHHTSSLLIVINAGHISSGHKYNQLAWVWPNHLHTGIGRFGSLLFKWGLTTTAVCDCGAKQQTPDYILYHCPIYNPTRKKWAIIIG